MKADLEKEEEESDMRKKSDGIVSSLETILRSIDGLIKSFFQHILHQ